MRLSNYLVVYFILGALLPSAKGQLKATQLNTLETDSYYTFPIQPGKSNYLAGTMGELRSGHFHGGLDIKTAGTVGLPVHATAAGYVSRIKISEGGYGNALYLAHANGTTSVYGHLKNFNPKIGQYVRQAQYDKKSFTIELFPKKNELSVDEGQVIAYSGNSGSSGGPHLHFEIRDARQWPINPLKFGFSEIKDNITPSIYKMALITRDRNSRINHQFGRFEFDVVKKGSYYTITEPISAYGRIGVELLAYDKLNGANNQNGIPCIEMQVDGETLFSQNINTFSFDHTRDILAHINYEVDKTSGKKFNKLYIDDGNKLGFYKTGPSKGTINLTDGKDYQLAINLWDIYNNVSVLNFQIKGEKPMTTIEKDRANYSGPSGYQIMGNTLVLFEQMGQGTQSQVYSQRMKYEIEPDYVAGQMAVYLWDLAQGLPDSVKLCQETIKLPFKAAIPGSQSFNFYHDRANLSFPSNALYDSLYLMLDYTYDTNAKREIFKIHQDLAAIRKNIQILLKPQVAYDQNKTAVYALDKKGNASYEGGKWNGGNIEFKTRSLGHFTLLADTVAPTIKPISISEESLRFIIDDDLSGIDSYQAQINGQWVLMNYDYKRKLLWSEKLDDRIPFKGAVELKVIDNMGNTNNYQATI